MVIKHVIYNIIIGIICFCLGLVISFKSKPKIQYIPIDKEIRDSLYIVNDSIQYKIKYITKRYYEKRRMQGMPDILPVSLQDILHSWQPEL